MKITKGLNPVVRAAGVISAVAIVTGGVTFAALSSSVTLTDSTISTANANLQIFDGTVFANTAPGFAVTGLVPGAGSEENEFYLRNAGDTDLKVTAAIVGTPTAPEGGYGFAGWENLKVNFKSLEPGCVNNTVNTTAEALMAGEVELPCNPLTEGAQGNNSVPATEGNYTVSFDIAAAAVTGESAGITDLDLRFTGTAVGSTSAPAEEL